MIPSPTPTGTPHRRVLGPSNINGISSQILLTGGTNEADGKTVVCTSDGNSFPNLEGGSTHFAGPEGWGVISDVDDTVKVTMTPSPTGILQTTFADLPQTTPGMPEFYKILNESLKQPAWFYLSASPYNLYPFLHQFLQEHYPKGTMILRDASWMSFAGLLQSLTQGTQEYKTDRMEKIHRWLPRRHFVCIGDSTQSDPESYAAMYTKYPDWIKAIYIRKVTDAPNMETKNKPQRFRDAFKEVPDHVWRVFVNPTEVADHLKHVAGIAHAGVLGQMLSL
jgi:phosphatidate phosphatase APP1